MKTRLLFLLIVIFSVFRSMANPPVEEGKNIFNSRCAGCHNIHKVLTGPALANVDQRHTIDWIINFVHSSQTVIKSGDQAAVALFEKFNHIQMPDHPDLTADNIKSVVEYIKAESKAVAETKTAVAAATNGQSTDFSFSWANHSALILIFSMLTGMLVTAIYLALYVKALQRKAADKQA